MTSGVTTFGLIPPIYFAQPGVAIDTSFLEEPIHHPYPNTSRFDETPDLAMSLAGILKGGGSAPGSDQVRGGGPLQGGGGNGGRNNGLPPFHLSRIHFQPSDHSPHHHRLLDRRLLEIAHDRLGSVITDAVLVIGNSLVTHRGLRNKLAVLAQQDGSDSRLGELAMHAQGRILDIAFGNHGRNGFPLLRLTSRFNTRLTAIREYRFYQKEGAPIVVVLHSDDASALVQGESDVVNPSLRKDLLELERKMDRVVVSELKLLIDILRANAISPSKTDKFLNFFQGYTLMLEAKSPSRLPQEFFEALWRLIYQVRLARLTHRRVVSTSVEEGYRRVMLYLKVPPPAMRSSSTK